MSFKHSLFALVAVATLALATTALATTALADDDGKTQQAVKKHVAVFINKDDDSSEAKIKLKMNGETWKFQLPTLSDGEERIIATEDGRTVKAKRSGKEVSIEAGGETIKLPAEGHGMHVRFHGVPAIPATPAIPAIPAIPSIPAEELKALHNSVVISGVELTEKQQQQIRDAIKQAGVDKPVRFVQHGRHMMLHGKGPMVWHDKGSKDTVHTVIVITDDGKQEVVTENIEGSDTAIIQRDIEVIRGKESDTQ